MTTHGSDGLVSPSDIAELAGVSRGAVSNWRRRQEDFPRASAGSEAKPLFSRRSVVHWLREQGYEVREEGPGQRLWSLMNALRGELPTDQVAELLLLLATVKKASDSEAIAFDFHAFASANQDVQRIELTRAVAELTRLPDFEPFGLTPDLEGVSRQALAVLAQGIAQAADDALGSGVDYVLERLTRWQVKAGADNGFLGSRTSTLASSLVTGDSGTVLDPACGIANVLVRIADEGTAARLVGRDVNRKAIQVAAQRAFLHGADIDLAVADILAADPDPGLLADVVFAEPPFGMKWDASDALSDPRFRFGVPSKSSADLAWIQHAIAHLKPTGIGYVLTSHGALFRSGLERKVRAKLLSEGCVEAIVGLPTKMLPHTSIALALWVLRRSSVASDVLVIDASEVVDVEDRIASWVGAGRSRDVEISAPHARVNISDVLAAEADLSPAKWVGRPRIDESDIAASFAAASAATSRILREMADLDVDFGQVSDLPEARITTIGDLIDNGVIETRSGRPDRTRQLDDREQHLVVKASAVKSGRLPLTDESAQIDQPDVTQPGDVLVTTMNEVRTVVDHAGGHLPSTGVDRLRIIDPATLTSGYLATVLRGSWNARHQRGSTISRAALRELELPLIPLERQALVEQANQTTTRIREQSSLLAEQATQTNEAILDALRYKVSLPGHVDARATEQE